MPRLVIRKGEGAGRDLALGGECVVGRHPSVTFPLLDSLVSRRHVRVFQDAGRWVAEDLGSTNGTRLNGERIRRHSLTDGDLIGIGTTEIEFVQKDLLAPKGGTAKSARSITGRSPTVPGPARAPAPVRRRRR